jgi:hypothetical protein
LAVYRATADRADAAQDALAAWSLEQRGRLPVARKRGGPPRGRGAPAFPATRGLCNALEIARDESGLLQAPAFDARAGRSRKKLERTKATDK